MLDVLRVPGAIVLFTASCVARLPMGAVGLLLVLYTHDLTGSYGRAGLAAGAYALCLGISNPLLARLIDRRGQTLVLRAGGLVSSSVLLGTALLPDAVGTRPPGARRGAGDRALALSGVRFPAPRIGEAAVYRANGLRRRILPYQDIGSTDGAPDSGPLTAPTLLPTVSGTEHSEAAAHPRGGLKSLNRAVGLQTTARRSMIGL